MRTLLKKARLAGALILAAALAAPSAFAGSDWSPYRGGPALALGWRDGDRLYQASHRRGYYDGGDRLSRWEYCQLYPRQCRDFRGDVYADRDEFRPRYRRGYRGYPYYRQGYRLGDDGWWYPLAAFAITMMIANQYDRDDRDDDYGYGGGGGGSGWSHIPARNMQAHDTWCANRYRSYSWSNKTYQPYDGPRRYCNSPYDLL